MNRRGIINNIETDCKTVAITFDDGPNPVYTPQVLEIFQEVSGNVTFYMIGEQMEKHPEIFEAVVEHGHEVGNHTYTHPKLTELSDNDCYSEIDRTDRLIREMTGNKPLTFRPPYLDYNEQVQSIVERFGYSVAGAVNMDAQDWEQPGVEHIYSKSLENVSNGSILLFHDGFGDRSQTIEALRKLVAELDDQGYQFVTLTELLNLPTNLSVKEK
ncbi:polysaccharide deacetylase family protein [Aquibacillus albus]|uniref:Peptidoglycan/xylan/chitin deacetylase (PgdA/CDA1 family) n=1 Tax=Aquibacillus albus TaxID=1168171 RepID=A0ABS2MWT3_9BACI|nr:polysaccharide deacetylase family protein [Aquibacillus albus]MBM7570316.1 peptidoglycan/xylan/chitin deacetylase (PgdA/CDA1 family) [Aquibacillus albus]